MDYTMIGLGLVLGAALVWLLRRDPRRELRLWAWLLVGAVAVYLVFAALPGAATRDLAVELAGGVPFLLLAWPKGPMVRLRLGAAWTLHPLWDVLAHPALTTVAPGWYPPLCVGFDLAVGAYLLLRGDR